MAGHNCSEQNGRPQLQQAKRQATLTGSGTAGGTGNSKEGRSQMQSAERQARLQGTDRQPATVTAKGQATSNAQNGRLQYQ